MNKFYNETYRKLENSIKELEIETDCPIKRIEAVVQLIIQSLADLKEFVDKPLPIDPLDITSMLTPVTGILTPSGKSRVK